MLYHEMIEDERAVMEESLVEPSKTLRPHEIQVPLRSLMRPPVLIEEGASVQDAVDLMIARKVGYVIVVSNQKLKGIFGERDVLLKILNKSVVDLTQVPVERYMVANPKTLHEEDSLDAALWFMSKGGYRHIPIVNDDNQPVGMVSVRHIISYIVEHFPQEILTLPPKPTRGVMQAREGA